MKKDLQDIKGLVNGYASSEDRSFLLNNVTKDFFAIRPSRNPISAEGLLDIFDNSDLGLNLRN
tara:strand:+ start:6626 stop:6814 length:189 start_codon:yes stop_codon:yes gene_type:complete